MAEFAIPSAVTLLQAKIEKHNAMGQRFPEKLNGDAPRGKDTQRGGVRSSTDDFFRSARAAPNERVRLSVRAHPNASHRNDLPLDLRDEHPEASSPPKGAGKSPNRSLDGGTSGLHQSSVGGKVASGKEESNRFRMGVPQRVEPPKDLNTPARVEDGTMVSAAEQGDTAAAAESAGVSRRQASVTKLKDQEMLAFACRRANKTRSEALAYYNMGVLHDNDKEYDKANGCYDQYLKAARASGDAKGEQLALNSMGINYFKIADHAAAIDMHNQHLQIADVAGKFVAHTNLGLSYAALDELEKASINHRQALRYRNPPAPPRPPISRSGSACPIRELRHVLVRRLDIQGAAVARV